MSREKKPTLFFSFPTTFAAMEAERICREAGIPGRLVPIPREITAGCGLAWMSEPEQEPAIRAFFRSRQLQFEGSTILEFFWP